MVSDSAYAPRSRRGGRAGRGASRRPGAARGAPAAGCAARQPRVRAFGFTDAVPALMAAADLVITSSGDTCTEARVVGRPLLLLDVVQGHGRDNLQHELELGEAAVTSPGMTDIVR